VEISGVLGDTGTYLVIKLVIGRKERMIRKSKLASLVSVGCFDGEHGGRQRISGTSAVVQLISLIVTVTSHVTSPASGN
jgi:hypothetical protein